MCQCEAFRRSELCVIDGSVQHFVTWQKQHVGPMGIAWGTMNQLQTSTSGLFVKRGGGSLCTVRVVNGVNGGGVFNDTRDLITSIHVLMEQQITELLSKAQFTLDNNSNSDNRNNLCHLWSPLHLAPRVEPRPSTKLSSVLLCTRRLETQQQ